MWKYEQGTPCPALAQHGDLFSPPVFVDKQKPSTASAPIQAASRTSRAGKGANMIEDVFEDYNDNTTRNISKLMRDEFKNARLGMPIKPRRVHASNAVGVFEDEQKEMQRTEMSGGVSGMGNGLMGGAALKARRPQKIKLETVKEDHRIGAALGARKSVMQHNVAPVAVPDASFASDENSLCEEETIHARPSKDDRRRTIWMPSDDTSVLSIHPGAYNHTLQDDTICLPPQRGYHAKTPRAESLQKRLSGARQTMSVAPKRAPLKALAPSQPNANLYDRVRCINGKENIPPNAGVFKDASRTVYDRLDLKPLKAFIEPISKPSPINRTSSISQPTAASQARTSFLKKRSAPEPKDDMRRTKMAVTKDPRPRLSAEIKPSLKLSEIKAAGRLSLERQAADKNAPTKLSAPSVPPPVNANLARYPVLPDDLVQPELYEDNWLNHQEVALTQLINSVFQQADSTSLVPRDDLLSLRTRMLKSYQEATVVALHKKLKASLVYGALSVPKDNKDLPRLREDVGLRRQFLDLWVLTYDLNALQAAAEVIIGRSLTSRPRDAASVTQSLGSTSGATASIKEREIRRFLLTFLIHHEDAVNISANQQRIVEENTPRVGSPEWFWQKTVLQSLMLIHLLDSSKTTGRISTCLFQTTSIRKSSQSVLHAFTRMMVPWIGDIIRPLTHIDYSASHSQQPLSEYNYCVANLATDLRNGVLLTRFVELLLYPSSTLAARPDQTLTFGLPDGETLTSILATSSPFDTASWPLSSHLKVPCSSRAQKIHNVSIALSALASVDAAVTSAAIASTTADDIVDGHREKTLSLLWSLVSRWGMGLLVDWDELKRETARFAGDSLPFNSKLFLLNDDTIDDEKEKAKSIPDEAEQAQLLKSWAAAICAKDNISVTNLTTSFSSGTVLSTLISAYADILPPSSSSRPRSTKANTPADALKALGCSSSFTSLFASAAGTTIPARSSTLALLAFLASRLLPLARANRAAKVLQRAWRRVSTRREISKRITCMRLARQCQEAVRIKTEVLDLVVLVQRRWRGILLGRREDLDADLEAFQRVARGWSVRRELWGRAKGRKGQTEGRRIMGGW